MKTRFVSLAAATLLGMSAAQAQDGTNPAMPQGHPFLVQEGGGVMIYPVPQTPLVYGLVNGRRVLIDPATMRIVYTLRP